MNNEESLKNCPGCGQDYLIKDFLTYDTCYRCTYKRKLLIAEKETKKERKCLICKKQLTSNRWKYCSDACLIISRNEKNRNWWVFKCKSEKIDWKNL